MSLAARRARSWASLFIILVTAVPGAFAGWSGMGNHEPSTSRDITDHWMFTDPDTNATGNKVYFNGFLGEDITAVSPNVGTVGSALTPHGAESYWAMLGVWRDCNKDGFVGLGDQGLFEYRAELLLDQSICAPQPTPLTYCGAPPLNWVPSHNDGQWVREFLPISWLTWNFKNTCQGPGDVNPFNLNDNLSRVWADSGLPEGSTAAGGCAINPQPRGTFHSTGGALAYLDCFDGYQITDDFDAVVTALGLTSLSFADHPRDQYNSASAANVRNPWGEERDASYARVWDCSQPQLLNLYGLSTPGVPGVISPVWLNATNVSTPTTSLSPNPGGSPSGTANATVNGFDQCNRTHTDGGAGTGARYAKLPYATESNNANAPNGKTAPIADLTPMETTRPAAPWQAVLGKGTPSNLGVQAIGQYGNIGLASGSDGLWHNNVHWVTPRPTFSYVTYYAYVSPSAVSAYNLILPNGPITGTYGSARCGTQVSGVINGWQCDPALWYKDTGGLDNEPQDGRLGPTAKLGCTGTTRLAACVGTRVGAPFNLRDIDCMDQSTEPQRAAGAGPWQVFDIVEVPGVVYLPGLPWNDNFGASPHSCV